MKTGPGNVSDEFLGITSLQQANKRSKSTDIVNRHWFKNLESLGTLLDNNQNQQCFPC